MSLPGNSMRGVTLDANSVPSVPVSYVGVPGWAYGGFLTQEEQPRAIGLDSIAAGKNAKAYGDYSIAIGEHAEATDRASIAFGQGCRAYGYAGVALGASCVAEGASSTVPGGVAVGWGCIAGAMTVAMGSGVTTKSSGVHGTVHIGVSTDEEDTWVLSGVGLGIDCYGVGYPIGKRVSVGSVDACYGVGRDLIVDGYGSFSFGADFTNVVSETGFFMAGITTPMIGTGTSTGFTRKHVMPYAFIDYPAGPTALTEFQFGNNTILRNNSGVACTVTAPTATLVRNRYPSARVGDSIDVWMINPAAANTMTLTLGGGSGYDTASYVLAAVSAVCLRFTFTDVTVGASTLSLASIPFPATIF